MARTGPGRAYRHGLTLLELHDLFPTEAAARDWFAAQRWPSGRYCPLCGSTRTSAPGGVLAYWCSDCRRRFSVTSRTALERSHLPLRKWALAIYLHVTSLKGVSSMKLHRDLGITQKSAWFVLHRLREAFRDTGPVVPFAGPVEVDETYMGGKRRNMRNATRRKLAHTGRGPAGKTAVAGIRDQASRHVRAQVVESPDRATLHGFIQRHVAPDATVYSDEARAYQGLPFSHQTVNHSVREYVRDQVTTNGIESFWAVLKRAHMGTYHKISPEHLQRYVDEFAGRHNIRDHDTLDQMTAVVAGLVGKRLLYQDLVSRKASLAASE